MNARTRRPSLPREIGLALALGVVAAAVGATLMLVLPQATALRAVIALLGFVYVLYRLNASGKTTGRIVTLALWCLGTAGAWLALPVGAFLAAQAAMLWLVRSLYAHSSLLAAGKDLVISAFALAFAVWAALRSESLFLAAWCFFLVEALHVLIAERPAHKRGIAGPDEAADAFESAHRAAEAALARLARGA